MARKGSGLMLNSCPINRGRYKKYWLKQRGVAEGSNAGTKEARGFRRFYLRRWGGAAIELTLDAVAHNLMKLRSKIKTLTDDKLQQALMNSALCEG